MVAGARSINFTSGNVVYNYPASVAGEMTFSGHELTVDGRTFDLEKWSKITVEDQELTAGQVEIVYYGTSATAAVAGNVARYVDVTVSGAHVSVTQSEEVDETTCGEITYVLKGVTSDGSFTLTGSYKATVELQGVSITNPSGAALDIQDGKRIALSAKNGTENFLTDGDGSQKGAITCKGHLELKGKGVLTVTGNASHAIYAKEYVEIKNQTLTIAGAKKDGINCSQYFLMNSGSVTISGTGDDGIQVSYKDDVDREPEDTGTFTFADGTLNITVSADASKCVKADGDVVISGGEINLVTDANGIWDSAKLKTKASACIGADGNVNISGGNLDLNATGSGGKGISCDGVFTGDGGTVTIATTGGMLAYTGGTLNHNYTGSSDRINSDYKSSSKGIKADGGVVINNGDYHVTTSTNNAEGIESKKTLAINGGTIFVKAYDDGINSANDFSVTGGELTVISIVGDGLDSNGNLTIAGGRVITMGSGGMEMGLDAATESGCAVYITGGEILSFGGNNTYPTRAGSTQPFVKTSGSVSAETEVLVKKGDEVLLSFTIPAEYTSSTGTMHGPGNGPGGGGWGPGGGSGNGSLMLSCPSLVSGQSYTIVNGTSTTSSTAALTGSGR